MTDAKPVEQRHRDAAEAWRLGRLQITMYDRDIESLAQHFARFERDLRPAGEMRKALQAADDTFEQVLDDMRDGGQCVCLAVKTEIEETHAIVRAALAAQPLDDNAAQGDG